MNSRDDLEPFSESLDDVFKKLGLPDPVLMSEIAGEWEALAGKTWSGRSQPLFVRGKTLIVEAATPSMVAFLRYGESELVERLKHRFGEGLIDAVEVQSPRRV